MKTSRTCSCRNCGSHYSESHSRAKLKGYCTAFCLEEKSKSAGYIKPKKKWQHPPKTQEQVLKDKGWIGSVYVDEF